MSEQSKNDRELLLKKHERAMKLRQEFNKQISNPYRHATGEGGAVFDPALQRFQAMRVSHYDHFKPTGKSFRTGFFAVVFPIIVYSWMLKTERESREKKYSTGQVAYKDRRFKFI